MCSPAHPEPSSCAKNVPLEVREGAMTTDRQQRGGSFNNSEINIIARDLIAAPILVADTARSAVTSYPAAARFSAILDP